MAEERHQDTDASNMMDCAENMDTSSGDLQLSIQLPKQLQGKEKKMKIKISRDATGEQLCNEIGKNLQNIKAEDMQLICKGKSLNLDKTLSEQNVKNKGVVALTLIDNEERKHVTFLSRIVKGAELLAKRDKGFEGNYFNATGHRGETVGLPESEKAVFLKALILHEVGRSNMKKSEYRNALWFLEQAEKEFRQCKEELLYSVDNYGVLNLDITWCYLQLSDIQSHADARERLERAQAHFDGCFGENHQRLQKQKDKSGRQRILNLRLLVLWGVWSFHDKDLVQSRKNFGKAEELLDQLLVDDYSVSTLVSQGYSTREARLALRAMDGNIEEAKSYIEEKRQEPTTSANSAPVAGSSPSPPADGTSVSAATGAQSNAEEDNILREILQYLPNDIDDYIDLSLEDEEAIVLEYKTKMSDSDQRSS